MLRPPWCPRGAPECAPPLTRACSPRAAAACFTPYLTASDMGNVPGMPEMPMADIQRIMGEVCGTFTPIYIKSYALGLIEKLKREADPGTPLAWQLRTPPIPDEILKEGWITKLGAVKQNWKRRYFVATNQARRGARGVGDARARARRLTTSACTTTRRRS